MKQTSSFSEWQMWCKIGLQEGFRMFQVVMNHAADDPLSPFTCQEAALLTTKSLQNHGMVDPSATDRLKGLLVDVSQIGTDCPSGLKSQRHCLALISYLQIGKVTWKSTDQRCNLQPLRCRSNLPPSDSLSRCVAAGYPQLQFLPKVEIQLDIQKRKWNQNLNYVLDLSKL